MASAQDPLLDRSDQVGNNRGPAVPGARRTSGSNWGREAAILVMALLGLAMLAGPLKYSTLEARQQQLTACAYAGIFLLGTAAVMTAGSYVFKTMNVSCNLKDGTFTFNGAAQEVADGANEAATTVRQVLVPQLHQILFRLNTLDGRGNGQGQVAAAQLPPQLPGQPEPVPFEGGSVLQGADLTTAFQSPLLTPELAEAERRLASACSKIAHGQRLLQMQRERGYVNLN